MLKWVFSVTAGIVVVAAIGTAIALAVLPGEVERSEGPPGPDLVPSELSALAESNPPKITISWTSGIPTDVTAVLQRSTTARDETWQEIATLAAGSTEYTDEDIVTGQTYLYRIRASRTDGSSGVSPVISTVSGS